MKDSERARNDLERKRLLGERAMAEEMSGSVWSIQTFFDVERFVDSIRKEPRWRQLEMERLGRDS